MEAHSDVYVKSSRNTQGASNVRPAHVRLVRGNASDPTAPVPRPPCSNTKESRAHSGILGVLMAMSERNGIQLADLFIDPVRGHDSPECEPSASRNTSQDVVPSDDSQ